MSKSSHLTGAEGSGSDSRKEFKQFLNMARRSTFENANILILLQKKGLIKENQLEKLLDDLDHLCRQITNFQNYLVTASRSWGVFSAMRYALAALRFNYE